MNKLILIIAVLALTSHIQAEPVVISESFHGNAFNDRDGWLTTQEANPNLNVVTACSGTKMFGGYNKFGARAVAHKNFLLPPHHTLIVKLQLWKIDSWDNEEFYVWVDDQLVWSKRFQVTEGGSQKCGGNSYSYNQGGGNWFEMILNLSINVKHSGPAAVIVFTSSLDQGANDESWAFRDFTLLVEKCPEGCAACVQGESADNCSSWNPVGGSWTSLDRLKLGAEGWTVTGGKTDTYQCGAVPVLGGFNNFGAKAAVAKTFKLPGHYRLKIKFLFVKIDSWDNEEAQLKVDNTFLWQRRFPYPFGYFGRICGSPHADWREMFARVEVEAAHTGPEAHVLITTTLDQAANDESFGVRDFYLFVAKCASNCDECTGPKPADCKKCANNWVVQDGVCKPLANFILLEQSFLQDQFTGANGWILKHNKGGAVISECQGKSMIGGYNVFGKGASAEKTFNVPPHKRLRIEATVYKIDSWDNEWFFLKVDQVDIWKAQWNLQTGGVNLCGIGSWPDGKFHVDQIFNHENSQAHVLMTSTLNQDANDESWGFRDFQIFYEPKEACAVFYSECDYKGASFEFCANSPNFQKDNIPPQIRSIRVPPQGRVTLYESTDYNGKKVVFTEDQSCIKHFDFRFLELHSEEWIPIQGQ